MKRIFSILLLGLLLSYGVFTTISAVSPLAFGSGGKWFRAPCDFSLRMTEIACLKTRTNPFDVWHGDIIKPPFRPNVNSTVSGPEFTEDINAYAPWEYTYLLPLSFLPRSVAWGFYFCLMMGALGYLFAVGYEKGRTRFGTWEAALFVGAGPLLLIAYPAWSNACIGNFSILVLAALVAMSRALDKGKEVRAGVLWALAMVKPQIAIIFAVPLLMRKRFLTCFVAGAICVVASFVPAVMCHISPLTLILQTPAANTFMFHGCGTWPYLFCGIFGHSLDICIALVIGLLLCVFLTRRLPPNVPWLGYLTPAAICSMSWTYVSTYGHVMAWFFLVELIILFAANPKDRCWRVFLALALVICTRGYNAYYGFLNACKNHFPDLIYSDMLHWHFDSLNSFLDLLVYVLFFMCVRSKDRHLMGMNRIR